jgi:hypothetical protein
MGVLPWRLVLEHRLLARLPRGYQNRTEGEKDANPGGHGKTIHPFSRWAGPTRAGNLPARFPLRHTASLRRSPCDARVSPAVAPAKTQVRAQKPRQKLSPQARTAPCKNGVLGKRRVRRCGGTAARRAAGARLTGLLGSVLRRRRRARLRQRAAARRVPRGWSMSSRRLRPRGHGQSAHSRDARIFLG